MLVNVKVRRPYILMSCLSTHRLFKVYARVSFVFDRFFSISTVSVSLLSSGWLNSSRPGWKNRRLYMARTTIAPSNTSMNRVVSYPAWYGYISALTEVHLCRNDNAVPAVRELNGTVHGPVS